MSQSLINALQNKALYLHDVQDFEVIETHISWVLLTGDYAYKIKKPVNFGFLDFTELSARKHFCEEELRLNQRLTDDLYLEVLPITGTLDAPVMGGEGEPIEYALKMRQFPQHQLLHAVQARGELSTQHIDDLAKRIAHFHGITPAVDRQHPLCSASAIMAPIRQNFEQIRPMLTEKADLTQLDALEKWTEDSFARLEPLLNERAQNGMIRECHGDLHLGNATLLNDQVALFDCIEFNEPFRLIDIASDAAFLAMDLEDRGLKSLANRFINGWLEHTGDYASVALLNLYKSYRALVRAKVGLFRLGQEQDPVQRAVIMRQYRSYADLAESYSAIPTLFLGVTHGVSAVGKSHVALRLVEALGAIRLRSDVERKRLFGQAKDQAVELDMYSPEATEQTYTHLHQTAEQILRAGHSVVIDATYLKGAQRRGARKVAETLGVPSIILACQAPMAVISQWLNERTEEGTDPSDATLEVIENQRLTQEAFSDDELTRVQTVATNDPESLDQLIDKLRQRFG